VAIDREGNNDPFSEWYDNYEMVGYSCIYDVFVVSGEP
jgi:hypothetical protein